MAGEELGQRNAVIPPLLVLQAFGRDRLVPYRPESCILVFLDPAKISFYRTGEATVEPLRPNQAAGAARLRYPVIAGAAWIASG